VELTHVEHDEVLRAPVQLLGQHERGLGRAHARGAGEHEDADRLARVIQFGAAGPDALGDYLRCVGLRDDALRQVLAHF
jgi:hypothetical protein